MTSVISSSALILPAPVGRLTEFAGGFSGACGPTAATVAAGAAQGFVISEQTMINTTREMQAHGWASANGASSIYGVDNWLKMHGLSTTLYGYAEPFPVDWHSIILAQAGVRPVIVEIANGQALHDVETGSGENAVNLHYHFICIVGKQADGYIVADGDNFQVLSRFQIYSYAVLAAARPCAMIVVNMARKAAPPVSNLPAGWTDDGTTLRAPNCPQVVTLGNRDWILSTNWRPENVPITSAYAWNGGTRQDFLYCSLAWDKTRGVYVCETEDQIVVDMRAQINAENQNIAKLQAALASADSQNANLSQQIAAMKQTETQRAAAAKALAAQVTTFANSL